MKLHSTDTDCYIPTGCPAELALSRTTHLGIGAHADDLEIMAFPGIERCFARTDDWFSGVVITDGAGSPRSGVYADYSAADMAALRKQEQREAALQGEYSAQLQLAYSSLELKKSRTAQVCQDLLAVLQATRPGVVYVHNPADSHASHVAAAQCAVQALRLLPVEQQPLAVYGVEVWRGLDWLPGQYRVELPIQNTDLQSQLLRCFDSQVSGGKRYDLAVAARATANATFGNSSTTDQYSACVLAMDLTPLLARPELSLGEFVQNCLQDFAISVKRQLSAE